MKAIDAFNALVRNETKKETNSSRTWKIETRKQTSQVALSKRSKLALFSRSVSLKVSFRKTRVIGRKPNCLNPNPQRWNTHTRCYSVYNAAPPGADRSPFAIGHLRLAGR